MPDVVIQVESLSKRYRLGVVGSRTLHHDFERWWARVRGKPDPYAKITRSLVHAEAPDRARAGADDESIWALQDLSFEVRRGEVLGIIGRNGAGKSTLLKILSRVTAPTTGEVRIKGRIASLLEVGTGFHPELTGRENIFLNGVILGMTKAEIRTKFDEIVAFSEVERFLDTPVKRYSSGMYVRLAFAVAAHLEPEILIVDEVLAVGDVAFQQKCIGKMSDVAKGGRTVLFVSHNMAAIQRLCGSSILLRGGRLGMAGAPAAVTDAYVREGMCSCLHWECPSGETTVQEHVIHRAFLADGTGRPRSIITTADSILLVMDIELRKDYPRMLLGVSLLDGNGDVIASTAPEEDGCPTPTSHGVYRVSVKMPQLGLLAKTYSLRICLGLPKNYVIVTALKFSVQETASRGYIDTVTPDARKGTIDTCCAWTVEPRETIRR